MQIANFEGNIEKYEKRLDKLDAEIRTLIS